MKGRVLITGASRGIGLGLTQRFLVEGYHVLASCRNPDGARDLWELETEFPGGLTLCEMDVADESSIQSCAKNSPEPLDILINNAGILPNGSAKFPELNSDDLLKAFTVNTMGPIKVTQAFLPQLQKSSAPKVCHISSKVGSISDNGGGGMYAYRLSKAALNMVNKSLSLEFPEIVCTVLHPGWVQTDMGGSNAPTDVISSSQGLFKVIAGLGEKDTGRFIDFRGDDIPW